MFISSIITQGTEISKKKMPRAKVQKKQSESKVLATNGNDVSTPTATEGNNNVGVNVKQPPKRQVRSKKATAATASEKVNDVQELETVVTKNTTTRGKIKSAEEIQTGKKNTLSATNGNEADSSTGAKSEGRAKNPPVQAPELDNPQVSEVVVKKTAGRGKKKTSEEPVETVESEGVKPKGRSKKPAIEITSEQSSVELVVSRGRGKKEKPVEQDDPTTVASVKTRAKREVKETARTTKRGRGTKRLADTEITEMLEAEGETEPEPKAKTARKKSAKQMKINDENVEVPVKKRGKKDAIEESQPLQDVQLPAPSKKSAPKRVNDKQKLELAASAPVSKSARGRKRAAARAKDDDDGDGDVLAVNEADSSTTSKIKKTATVKADTAAAGSYDKSLFPSPTDKVFNLKISSWNVAGLRAWLKKDGLKFVDVEEPDVFCLQETKCVYDQLPDEMTRLPGYHPYWLCMPGGYAGVAIYSKIMPINVEYGIGNEEFDDVGRMITAEYEKFYLINVYVPNSGRKLVNLEPRMRWEQLFQAYVKKLDALKPVIICGDMNVSHLEIDLANPKANIRNAGFTKEEREKMTELLTLGYVDTFRHLYPNRTGAYSFWTYMANARARNVGWRLDYCIVSQRFVSRIVDNVMRTHCLGSDHCPITVFLNI